jgi:hypothetical protein
MTLVILIYVYLLVFVGILIVVADSDEVGGVSPGQCQSNDSSRNYSVPEESVQVESFDLLGDEGGSRIGDHLINRQSDLPEADWPSDSWDDSWSRDDW